MDSLLPATLVSDCIDGPRTASSRRRRRSTRNVRVCGTSSRWIACGLPQQSENQRKKALQLVGRFPALLIVVRLAECFLLIERSIKFSPMSNRIQTRNGESGWIPVGALVSSHRRVSWDPTHPLLAGFPGGRRKCFTHRRECPGSVAVPGLSRSRSAGRMPRAPGRLCGCPPLSACGGDLKYEDIRTRLCEAERTTTMTTTTTPAEFYHRRAAECSVLAHQIADSNERAIMQELARCWIRLLVRTSAEGSAPAASSPLGIKPASAISSFSAGRAWAGFAASRAEAYSTMTCGPLCRRYIG